jgi:hypothetical protein
MVDTDASDRLIGNHHSAWFAPNSGDYQSPAGFHPAPHQQDQ